MDTSSQPFTVSVTQLAKMLNCGVSTVNRYKAMGKLPRPISLGRLVRWSTSEIQAWIAAGTPDQKSWDKVRAVHLGLPVGKK